MRQFTCKGTEGGITEEHYANKGKNARRRNVKKGTEKKEMDAKCQGEEEIQGEEETQGSGVSGGKRGKMCWYACINSGYPRAFQRLSVRPGATLRRGVKRPTAGLSAAGRPPRASLQSNGGKKGTFSRLRHAEPHARMRCHKGGEYANTRYSKCAPRD